MTETPASDGRRYGGRDADERRAARRLTLLAAGLEEFGTRGYAHTSVKQLCRSAGLSERYFYESFDGREALLTAVYDEVVAEVLARSAEAITATADQPLPRLAEASLGAFVGCLTADRRKARVMLLEVVGVSAALETRRHGVIQRFAGVIRAAGLAKAPTALPEQPWHSVVAVALVGSVNQLLVDWISGEDGRDPGLILDVCTGLFTAAFDRFFVDTRR